MPIVNVRSDSREVSAHVDLPAGGEPTRVVFDSTTIHSVNVINDGAGRAWYTTDGSTPVPGGKRTYRLPAQSADNDRRVPYQSWPQGPTVITLIAEAETAVSVQRVY